LKTLQAAGPNGKVIGVDLSSGHIASATEKAAARQLGDRCTFLVGDVEKLPLADASVDVVISNGAFCLAPNKRAGFSEIARCDIILTLF
jgi:ubiquinone/menaquinone biosynthesis C-methylase UbiE